MSKPNLKSQAKRKRELAKKDKRAQKDEKRAVRKAERSGRSGDEVTAPEPEPVGPALAVPPGGVLEPLRLSALTRIPRS